MTKKDFKKIADYSIALMEEVSLDIKRLSEYVWSPNWNNLDDINKKIDLARGYWVNVDALDNQILEFRIILFKRRIEYKIDEVHNTKTKLSFDINIIEAEYKELKREPSVDLGKLQILMHDLYNEVIKSKIKFMINDIERDPNSTYSIDQVAHELELAKEKWINVGEIEEILFE